jgi:hypothetical protein
MQGPQKNKLKESKKNKKKPLHLSVHAAARSRRATASHRPLRAAIALPTTVDCPTATRLGAIGGRDHSYAGSPFCIPPAPFLLPLAPKILHMWSSLPHWLQHMPALPRLLLKTSNIHNF